MPESSLIDAMEASTRRDHEPFTFASLRYPDPLTMLWTGLHITLNWKSVTNA